MVPVVLGFSPPSPPLPSPLSQTIGIARIVPLPNLRKTTSSVGDHQAIGICRAVLGKDLSVSRNSSTPGLCRASQAVDFFPSTSSEVVVRDARIKDCWEVADTHCSSFFPNYVFPLDLVLRIDRFVALLSGFSVPPGCVRACLVAVAGCAIDDNFYLESEDFKVGDFEGKYSFCRGSVVGILTVDTIADFLPRKGPLQKRRIGIAYVSNVAVRETQRRKGIAKRLVAQAEARARLWGCRAIALHCETNNLAAAKLYKGLGFQSINVPEHANWPQPNTTPGSQFIFMMKLLTSGSCQDRWHLFP